MGGSSAVSQVNFLMSSTIAKTARKAGKVMRRILPIKVRTVGWNDSVQSAYGVAVGMRNWNIAERPTIEPKSVNGNNTLYSFKKPVKVYLKGRVLSEKDGKIFLEADPEVAGVFEEIEEYVLTEGGKACLVDYGVHDNYNASAKLMWEKEGKKIVTLKAKWFEGQYTKPYLNGEETKHMPAVDDLVLEIVLQLYGLWADEDKSVVGTLAGVAAYNLLTE